MVILKDETNGIQTEIRQLVIVQRPDICSFDFDVAGVRSQDAGNHAQHGGLAAAGGTDDEQHLAKMSNQRDTIYGNLLGFAFTKPFGQTSGNNCLMILWNYGVGGIQMFERTFGFSGVSIIVERVGLPAPDNR